MKNVPGAWTMIVCEIICTHTRIYIYIYIYIYVCMDGWMDDRDYERKGLEVMSYGYRRKAKRVKDR